jgi:calcium-dependent protein kinase
MGCLNSTGQESTTPEGTNFKMKIKADVGRAG